MTRHHALSLFGKMRIFLATMASLAVVGVAEAGDKSHKSFGIESGFFVSVMQCQEFASAGFDDEADELDASARNPVLVGHHHCD